MTSGLAKIIAGADSCVDLSRTRVLPTLTAAEPTPSGERRNEHPYRPFRHIVYANVRYKTPRVLVLIKRELGSHPKIFEGLAQPSGIMLPVSA
jgi:hypothetical protein